jgi:hypothetical protein
MQKFNNAIDLIGFNRLGELIEEGDPCKMTQVLREALYK